MALTVLGGGVSPFVRKVRVFLAEKGLDYQHENVNPFGPPEGWLSGAEGRNAPQRANLPARRPEVPPWL